MIAIQIIIYNESYITATSDGPMSLRQAKDLADWPEWKKVIRVELEQIQAEGTWELVDKPPDAIPIANKWVFVKKMDRLGILIANKACLVIKGCSQRPRFNYTETYSPVVHIETVCAILALVSNLNLHVHQIDIKGAYLNGILKETIYMHQLEGFTDGTNRVCKLNKMLYGLKQSGRKCKGACHARTSRAGRSRTTVAVPGPLRGHFNHLNGRWTGQPKPVQNRQSTSVTAVQTVGWVSPTIPTK